MPCNCSGICMKTCSCRVFGYPLKKNETHNLVLVTQNGMSYDDGRKSRNSRLNTLFRVFERLYDKCAGYNIRYCPLRGPRRDKHLTNAAKDLIIIMCFLVANLVVFLNIATRLLIHVYMIFTAAAAWIKRCVLKSECDYTLRFHPPQESEYEYETFAPINHN